MAAWMIAAMCLALTHCRTGEPRQPTGEDAPPLLAPVVVDAAGTYLAPNIRDRDGTPAFVHYTPADMPLRVSIGRPPTGADDGSSLEAREAAIRGMQLWADAIAPAAPWFELRFTDDDPSAALQVQWKRRMTGSAVGRGWIGWRVEDERLFVQSGIQASMRPWASVSEQALSLAEVELLFAHEFGHALGLGHCLDCDSAMNDSWQTHKRLLVTPLDVHTFLALTARPNGTRVDGLRMHGFPR